MQKSWGGFNLAILKVKQIHYILKKKKIEVFTIELRPLTSYFYLKKKNYYHDHMTVPNPQTTSFSDLQQSQVLLLVTLRLHSKVLDLLKFFMQQLKRSSTS